ncbi:hypothetical protein HORIV_02770 [Vreelandella olivaria]|uniref:D-alanyl-D-alanine carboxypeptidase n=1 Tax=Vreelandella olivaria TaxID=390919 RepID=A0ABN5WLH3_9GAMM|nr:hypothetical protein HORIV_02770 [Halomonas olivaria]
MVRDYPGADGLKTGFIRASGFNVATTAMRGNRRLVGVVMGGFSSQSRDTHMANLLDRSFLRASLRDQQSWMGDTNFSREFMAFAPPAQPVAPHSLRPSNLFWRWSKPLPCRHRPTPPPRRRWLTLKSS